MAPRQITEAQERAFFSYTKVKLGTTMGGVPIWVCGQCGVTVAQSVSGSWYHVGDELLANFKCQLLQEGE